MKFSIHPGSTKMYWDLNWQFWWRKVEHQRPAGLLQPLPVSEWKWDHITMDFVSCLLRTSRGHNDVCFVVDLLTKSTHFLAMKTIDSLSALNRLYVAEIVRLHGVPL